MPIIRASEDLKEKYSEISEIIKNNEPVFLTEKGDGAAVVMSMSLYDKLVAKVELIEELAKGINDINNGNVISLEESRKRIAAKHG